MKNENGETESTVCIDMWQIMEKLKLRDWNSPSPANIEKFKRAVLAKIDDKTDTVEMVGHMPESVGMVVAAALAQRVRRFEYGRYNNVRHTIFDYSEQCPEMKV